MAKAEKFEISQEQAHKFAKAIFADIEDYVKTHQKEFEEFLQEEGEVVKLCSDEKRP